MPIYHNQALHAASVSHRCPILASTWVLAGPRLGDNIAELAVFVEVKTHVIEGEEAEITEDVPLLEGEA
jgi:hypothetical protein